jgi:AcrR family transcriptional regulator
MNEYLKRTEKTAATRARVIDCARALFLAQGYAVTTTRQVATSAHVTERTLFNVVASKSDLLREVLLTYVFTGEHGPLLERKDFAPVLGADNLEAFLTRYSQWVADLHRRTAAVAELTRAAASVDPGAAELWAWGNAQQIVDLDNLVKVLGQRHWLRPDLPRREVVRSLDVLSGHGTYWRLVTEQHWSLSAYRRWLRRHCATELVADRASTLGSEGAQPQQ